MVLPSKVDRTEDGYIVPRAGVGQEGYCDNVEYTLTISVELGFVEIGYKGEDDTWLEDDEISMIIENEVLFRCL
jgi:hypothetical protein